MSKGWTYTLLPAHLGTPGFIMDPSNQSVIYSVNAGCIAASYTTGGAGTPQNMDYPPKTMARITSDCGVTRSLSIKWP